VLAFGRKVPRWPEYHEPAWALENEKMLQGSLLEFEARVIERYRNLSNLKFWQVENEPFINFGSGRFKIKKHEFAEELKLVRSLDDRKVVVTDSGEHSNWKQAARYADIIGVNIYTAVFDSFRKRYHYHNLSPEFYAGKIEKAGRPAIVAELQAEPWGPGPVTALVSSEIEKTISPERLKANLQLAEAAGFEEIWFWGSEWWSWLASKGNDAMIETARNLINT
jgi:hypothetical protein